MKKFKFYLNKKIKKTKILLEKILESSIEAFVITNTELEILKANQNFLDIVHANCLAQIKCKKITEFIAPNNIDEFKTQIRRTKFCSKIEFELTIVTLTKLEIPSIFTIVPINSTNSIKILGYIFTVIVSDDNKCLEIINTKLSLYQRFISEISQKALTTKDENILLYELLSKLCKIIKTEFIALFYQTNNEQQYIIKACHGFDKQDYENLKLNISECAEIFFPISSKEPFISNHIHNNELNKFSILAKKINAKSLFSSCIWIKNKPKCVLAIYFIEPIEFSLLEIQFFLNICRTISNFWTTKQTEDELYASKELLNTIIETIPESILLVEGNKIIFSNSSAKKLLELHTIDNNNIEIFITSFIYPDYLISFEENIRELTLNKPTIFESKVISNTSKVIPVEFFIKKINLNNKIIHFIYIRDLTNLKKAEYEKEKLYNQLFQSQKMGIIGKIAGEIAHDYNNMLGVILGHIEFLEELIENNPLLKGSLNEIKKAAESSANLTRQLLAFSRQQIAIPKAVNLNQVIQSLEKIIKKLIGENVELIINLDHNDPNIKIDPTQLEQIITNLCIYAKDSMNDKDVRRIEIKTELIKFEKETIYNDIEFDAGEYVKLTFIDNGSGMDKETLTNIFEPFYTKKDKEHGSGLGLATVLGIVKQNKGNICVTSQVNVGTKFELFFPAFYSTKIDETNNNERKQLERQYSKNIYIDKQKIIRVLIVEDDENLIQTVKKMLEIKGYKVHTVNIPEHAINLLNMHELKLDLALIDIILPNMNGIKLAHEIRKLSPTIKIGFISGYPLEVIKQHYKIDPEINILQKPFSSSEFINFVETLLNN